MRNNIIEVLLHYAEFYRDKAALIHKSEEISYKDLIEEVKKYAFYLQQKGIKKGDKVLIFVPMSIELYKIILSVYFIGATAVFVDAWANIKRLEEAVRIAGCKAFIGLPKAHWLRLLSAQIRKIPVKIVADRKELPDSEQNIDPETVNNDDIALITFTTGSTGIPKAAKRTHEFLLAQHRVLKSHLNYNINDIDLTTLPIFVLNNLASGITSVIPDFNPKKPANIKPENILTDMIRHKTTTTIGSPAFYSKLADYCILINKHPESLKKIFLGGAPVFPHLAEKLIKAFPDTDIEIVYGSTEAEPISFIKAGDLAEYSENTRVKGLAVGKPIEAIDLKIIQISDETITVKSESEFLNLEQQKGEAGEICVSGEHVLKEYYNNPEAQQFSKINVEGKIWHRTGDAGYIDENNSLFLMGRTKNRISYKGQTLFVFPIEASLSKLEQVETGTIIKLKNKLYLVIEPDKNYKRSKHTIDEKVRVLNFPFDELIILNKIPRDPRHKSKIDYDRLKILLS